MFKLFKSAYLINYDLVNLEYSHQFLLIKILVFKTILKILFIYKFILHASLINLS